MHAPGLASPPDFLAACHHVNLAHGRAVRVLRESPGARVGISLQLPAIHPVTGSAEDAAAARRFDGLFNRWYLDAILKGSYPEDARALLEPFGLPIQAGDLAEAAAPIDFVGLNHYTRIFVKHDPQIPIFALRPLEQHLVPGAAYTSMGWEIYPSGLYEVLTRLRTEYSNPPVYVTENGCALDDVVEDSNGGRVHDPGRSAFLADYLAAAHRALGEGADLRGYFVWSLLDNYEWTHGYSKRFGLVHVDEPTGRRIVKDSARWYAGVIRASGV
jgi:beta-glucosidase